MFVCATFVETEYICTNRVLSATKISDASVSADVVMVVYMTSGLKRTGGALEHLGVVGGAVLHL